MRAMFYWAIVLFFFGSGAWLMINKDSSEPYEIPYLSGDFSMASIMSTDTPFKKEAEVVPQEERKNILVGHWTFRTQLEEVENEIEVIEGTVEYKADGTFFKRLTYKMYWSNRGLRKDDSEVIEGGSLTGTWKLNDNDTWQETVGKCNIRNTKGKSSRYSKNLCKEVFKKGRKKVYGTYEDDFYTSELRKFTAKKISIKKKSFASATMNFFTLTKVED